MDTQTKVTGVILAGGLARRMDKRDKGLVCFKGQPLVTYAIAALRPVVDQLIINANRNITDYEQFGLPVIRDSNQTDTFDGPLAGILSAMSYAKTNLLLTMPCDSPLVKPTHLQKLLAALTEHDADVAVAFDGERLHPVVLALKTSLKPSLQNYLTSGQRKISVWLEQQKMVRVDFSTEPDVFININYLRELSDLEARDDR